MEVSANLLDYFEDEGLKEVVKTTIEDLEMDPTKYRVAKWIPSKPEKVEKRSLGEEEEPLTIVNEKITGMQRGKRLAYLTIQSVSWLTTTFTKTTSLGTIGVTGTTSECGSTSITDYLSTC